MARNFFFFRFQLQMFSLVKYILEIKKQFAVQNYPY